MKLIKLFSGIDGFSMESMLEVSLATVSLKNDAFSCSEHLSGNMDGAINDVFTMSVENDIFYDALLALAGGFKKNQSVTCFDFKEVFRSHSRFEYGFYSSLTVEQWGELKVWVSSVAASNTRYSKAIYNVYRKECAGHVDEECLDLVATVLTLQTLLFSMDRAFRRRTNRGNKHISDVQQALSALVQEKDKEVLEVIDVSETSQIMDKLRASILAAIRAELPGHLPSLQC